MIREIKGNEMRMIHVHSRGSTMFSEAYFVLRGESAPMSDMVEEARRIIRRYSEEGDEFRLLRSDKRERRRFWIGLLTGIAASAAVLTPLLLLIK